MPANAGQPVSSSMLDLPFRQQITMVYRNLSPLLHLLWKTSPLLILVQLALNGIQSLMPGTVTYMSKVGVDALTQIARGDKGAVRVALIILLITAALQLVGMGLGLGLSYSERLLNAYFTQKVEIMVASKAQALPLTFFDQSQSYDQLQRAHNNFGDRGLAVATSVMRIGSVIITLTSYLALTALANRWLPLLLVPVVAAALYMNMRWGQRRYQLARAQTQPQREAGYLSGMLTGPEFAKEVRLFSLGPYILQRWLERYIDLRNQNLRLFWRQNLAFLANSGLNFAASFSTMLWLFYRVVAGGISIGTYLATSGAVTAAIGLMPQLANLIIQIYEHALFTNDLFVFLALPEEPVTGTLPFPSRLRHGITAENLEFSYPGTGRPVLKNLSFTIRPGERVAIVGENGSGKTTLVKCLLGLYRPDRGSIQYDGTDIRSFDRNLFRQQVTAVFQDFARYALTIRDNIGFGNLSRWGDEAALLNAAEQAGAMDAVNRFPERWDTRLTRMWDGGQELSYGQWQRLAIARSLMRDAQVVVLDEPTAALDPKAEAALVEQFSQVTSGRTSLIISHRLGTARTADHILVLKNGELVEEGTHDQLMQRNAEYARMFRLQAQWYVQAPAVATAD